MAEEIVCVTDSHTKHGLAAVRALRGEKIAVASHKKRNPTSFSRFVWKSVTHKEYPPESGFFDMVKQLEEMGGDILVPIGYHTNTLLSKYRKSINLKFEIPPSRSVETVADKVKFYRFAQRRGIRIPETIFVNDLTDINDFNKFPAVVKSSQEMVGRKVEYAKNKTELRNIVKRRIKLGPQIVQEKVEGKGRGFFAIYNQGKLKAFFMHERIREFPESGGVSSFSKSFFSLKLFEEGKKVLDRLKWNGVAMVEFKGDYILEINAKFWGSLDLAISSGVNFPKLYLDLVRGEKIKFDGYNFVRFQWLLPEDTWRIKTAKNKFKAAFESLRDLLNPYIKKDVQYLISDPVPTVARMGWTLWGMLKG